MRPSSLARIGVGFVVGVAVTLAAVPAFGEPVAADGQILQRSDGFLYLVRNGARHWIQPVPLSDDDINAIPEQEPYTLGLEPIGAGAVTGHEIPAGAAVLVLQATSRPYAADVNHQPTTGQEWLAVRVAVRNVSAETFTVNPYDFQVQLADATVRSHGLMGRSDELHAFDVLPGQTVAGTIGYQVPIGLAVTSLVYDPPLYDDQPVLVPLSEH